MDDEVFKDFWEDFIDLTERYEDEGAKVLGYTTAMFASRMLHDLLPLREASEVIKHAFNDGRNWSIGECHHENITCRCNEDER